MKTKRGQSSHGRLYLKNKKSSFNVYEDFVMKRRKQSIQQPSVVVGPPKIPLSEPDPFFD